MPAGRDGGSLGVETVCRVGHRKRYLFADLAHEVRGLIDKERYHRRWDIRVVFSERFTLAITATLRTHRLEIPSN